MESLRSKVTSEGDGAAEDQAIKGGVAQALLEAKCLIHSLGRSSNTDSEREPEDDQDMAFDEPEEAAIDPLQQEHAQPSQSCWTEEREEIDTGSEELVPDKGEEAMQIGAECQLQQPEEPPIKQARTSASARAAPY